jgi:hypothetical protein
MHMANGYGRELSDGLQVRGLMNNGAISTAVDFTVAMNPCAFPCKVQSHQQQKKTRRSGIRLGFKDEGKKCFISLIIPDQLRLLP